MSSSVEFEPISVIVARLVDGLARPVVTPAPSFIGKSSVTPNRFRGYPTKGSSVSTFHAARHSAIAGEAEIVDAVLVSSRQPIRTTAEAFSVIEFGKRPGSFTPASLAIFEVEKNGHPIRMTSAVRAPHLAIVATMEVL